VGDRPIRSRGGTDTACPQTCPDLVQQSVWPWHCMVSERQTNIATTSQTSLASRYRWAVAGAFATPGDLPSSVPIHHGWGRMDDGTMGVDAFGGGVGSPAVPKMDHGLHREACPKRDCGNHDNLRTRGRNNKTAFISTLPSCCSRLSCCPRLPPYSIYPFVALAAS
jgi:hypothetical protein